MIHVVPLCLMNHPYPATKYRNIKSASLTRTNRNCDGSGDMPLAETFGTVEFDRTLNLLVAVPVLLRGTPNTAYSVRFVQIVNGHGMGCPNCPAGQATLTTNKAGVGYASFQETVVPGATGAFVAINKKSDCSDFFTTPVLPIA